jgi:hypothetical protein
VTPEATRYLEKARQYLSNARATLNIGLSNDARRNTYLAAFHAAQAFIFRGLQAKSPKATPLEIRTDMGHLLQITLNLAFADPYLHSDFTN